MKVLFSIHLFYPQHACGAESYVYHLSEYLLKQGHEIRVLLHQSLWHKIEEPYDYNGIMVYPFHKGHAWELLNWCTHIISHLDYTPWSIDVASMWRKPVFFISHNFHPYPCVVDSTIPVNVIYNSFIMAETMKYKHRSTVLHPPLNQSKIDPQIRPHRGEYITLINCNERKGGSIFKELVKRMPERRFLCVLGGYDEQIIPQKPNIMCMRNSDDILPVYRLTRIILMPSAYESYGMVATEAMANGIPVICTPTPGLKENLADAGIYIDSLNTRRWMENHEKPAFDYLTSSDIDLWEEQIKALDDEKNYFSVSKKCKRRAAELDPTRELQAVEKFISDANS